MFSSVHYKHVPHYSISISKWKKNRNITFYTGAVLNIRSFKDFKLTIHRIMFGLFKILKTGNCHKNPWVLTSFEKSKDLATPHPYLPMAVNVPPGTGSVHSCTLLLSQCRASFLSSTSSFPSLILLAWFLEALELLPCVLCSTTSFYR